MKIPNKVKIGNVVYDIKLSDEVILMDNKRAYGQIDFNFHTIKIDNSLQDIQGQEETFFHEVFHGIVHQRNFDYDKTDEENITEELARGFHEFIKDNPLIFND